MKTTLKKIYSKLSKLEPKAGREIAGHFREINPDSVAELKQLIIKKLLIPLSPDHHLSKEGEADVATHVGGRLNRFRHYYIPWINTLKKINGSKILEIGGGTGSSTQALSEQGGQVTSIDVDQNALDIASFRLQHCGLSADLRKLNATEVGNHFENNHFDMILFFASLEHMTTEERIRSLETTWKLLKPGGQLFVLEAPNRLWFYDMHTAFLPFYFWLPDDLAILYSVKSERKLFRNSIHKSTGTEAFARWGRGVSYHEFELAGIPDLNNSCSLFDYHYKNRYFKQIVYRLNLNYKYKKIIRKIAPHRIPNAFLEPFLDLSIQKK